MIFAFMRIFAFSVRLSFWMRSMISFPYFK